MEHNPNGPYALAGYSFGGIVAFEMAKQLRANGKEVRMLAIFDTAASLRFSGNLLQKNIHFVTTFLKEQLYFIGLFFKNPIGMFFYQKNMLRIYAHKRFYTLKKWSTKQESVFYRKYSVERVNARALRKYHITRYDGTIDLFKAKKRTYYLSDPEFLGWKQLAQGLQIHEVNTKHNRFFELPYVKELATLLQECLDKKDIDQKQQDVFQNKRANLIAV